MTGIVLCCHNPSRATSQGHLARSFCEAGGSNKGIIHGMGQGRCQMLCSVTAQIKMAFSNKPLPWKKDKNSQNELNNKSDIISGVIKGKAEE